MSTRPSLFHTLLFRRIQHIARLVAPIMVVATLALLFQVRAGSAMLGAGSTCTYQLAQLVSAIESVAAPCCANHEVQKGKAAHTNDVPRDCCAGGVMPPHCCLTVVPALHHVLLEAIHTHQVTVELSHTESTLSRPHDPPLRPPILG